DRGPARLPRRGRARRHRRVLVCGRGADPRHPDRDRHVAPAPREAYPEEEPRGQGSGAMSDPCDECEAMMQPYLDGTLSDAQVEQAQAHLARCSWCAKRYRFEERLRHYVRVAVS